MRRKPNQRQGRLLQEKYKAKLQSFLQFIEETTSVPRLTARSTLSSVEPTTTNIYIIPRFDYSTTISSTHLVVTLTSNSARGDESDVGSKASCSRKVGGTLKQSHPNISHLLVILERSIPRKFIKHFKLAHAANKGDKDVEFVCLLCLILVDARSVWYLEFTDVK